MKIIYQLLLLTISLLFSVELTAQKLAIDSLQKKRSIGREVSFFVDESQNLSIDEIIFEDFKTSTMEVPNFGIARGNIWLCFTLTNNSRFEDLFLEISQSTLDEVVLYDLEKDRTDVQGDKYPFDQRDHNFTHFVFDLEISKGETKTYYVKVNSSNQVQVPMHLGSYDMIQQSNQNLNLFLSLFLGLMLAMIFYNAVLYFFVRDSSYLYYVLYISILTFTQLTPHGFAFQYFWPHSPWMSQYSMFIFPIAVGVSGILFFNVFLATKKYFPRLIWVFRFLFLLYAIAIVLVVTGEFKSAYSLIDLTAMTVALTMLIGAAVIYRRGNRTALYFLAAWTIFLVGIVFWVLKDTGVLPYNNLTNYMMLLGAGVETVLLSIGLADRINSYRKEKEESKMNEIRALRENERLISEQNVLLEQKVKERTEELEALNIELKKALESVIKTQNKLLESEKMASLGQLTAGVAHEINNPINFVSSNIEPLKRDLQDLEELLELYSQLDKDNFEEKIEEIEQFKEEIDLKYLKDELKEILRNIEEGARRTSEIVKGLKTFSRNDQKSKIPAHINAGIESTLTLLNSKLSDIHVELNLNDIPQILCYPGKLNQVIMNIITNSIDAVKAKFGKRKEGTIRIETSYNVERKEVQIEIEDNGTGIPEEIRKKIYDPFYTTKDVGKGTGLGLSIVYQIIEAHEGEIILESEEGKGTLFRIILPVKG
ncbi:MAG: 7TM diverse intracellular signaling domain-containing protein [Brumimicrobium sp.]|nr:7TM diverse intracellular signaling domain-containing protein [Brumimicrobium sp.]